MAPHDVQGPAQRIAAQIHEGAAASFRQVTDLFAAAVVDGDVEFCVDFRDASNLARVNPGQHLQVSRMISIVKSFDDALTCLTCSSQNGARFLRVHREWLFAKHMLAGFERLDAPFGMQIDGQCVVNQIDVVGAHQRFVIIGGTGKAMRVRKGLRPRPVTRRNHLQYRARAYLRRMNDGGRRNARRAQTTNAHGGDLGGCGFCHPIDIAPHVLACWDYSGQAFEHRCSRHFACARPLVRRLHDVLQASAYSGAEQTCPETVRQLQCRCWLQHIRQPPANMRGVLLHVHVERGDGRRMETIAQ